MLREVGPDAGPVAQAVGAVMEAAARHGTSANLTCRLVAAAARGSTQGLSGRCTEEQSGSEEGQTITQLEEVLMLVGDLAFGRKCSIREAKGAPA